MNHKIDILKLDLPALVVLGEEGTIAERQSFAVAGDPPQLDANMFREFLKRHSLPPREAKDLMKTAIRRAREEQKRILLQQSASNSYPCRLLSRFIDQHRGILDRDYIFVNLDTHRMADADAVIRDFRKSSEGAPWMAILSADGVKLIDSDAPTGNIGFPSEREGINYFIDKMFKPTAQRLTPNDLEDLRNALLGK